MVFRVNNKLAFEIPLSNVSQVPPGDKSETILEFYPSEVVSVNLVEMRFYSSNNSEEEESKLKKFREAIVKYVEGEAELPLCTFEQIRCVTPRYVMTGHEVILFVSVLATISRSTRLDWSFTARRSATRCC